MTEERHQWQLGNFRKSFAIPSPERAAKKKKEKKKENNVVYVLQYLSELIPQVDNLCISILRNTSYIKFGFSLPSSTSTRSHLGPTAKRS